MPGWGYNYKERGQTVTIPAFLFGFLVSTFLGASFHLWKNGGLGRLLLYLLLSWIGFWGGHFLADNLGWTFLSIGPLRFGLALLGCLILLFIGHWFSLIKTTPSHQHSK
ncbi:hypothetical protein ATHL_01434 [Anaerolinea thermolimosa]|nr:hypothetical protein ATHL_01434 [Anaerolinea thermolimosa]